MSLRRVFNWIVGLPVAILAVVFAVANRQWITVSFDPLNRDQPFAAVDMPLWVLFFCGILVGMVAGWTAAWFAHGKWRRAAREAKIEMVRAQNETDRLRREAQSRAVVPAQDVSL